MLATSPALRFRNNLQDEISGESTARYGSGAVFERPSFQDSYMDTGDTSASATQSPMTRSSSHSPNQSNSGTSSVALSMQSSADEHNQVEPRTAIGSMKSDEVGNDRMPTIVKHAENNVDISSRSPGTKRRQPVSPPSSHDACLSAQRSSSKKPKALVENAKVLADRYELCDVKDIVILIADMISELLQTNDNLPLRESVLTRFHSR